MMTIQGFPQHFKVFTAAYTLTLSVGYVFALINIYLVVGLTPEDIAVHYYGSSQKIAESGAQGEESIDLGNLLEVPHVAQPSLKNLVQEAHFHLFGMSSFFFGLILLGLFTTASSSVKSWLTGLSFSSIVIDNLSFLATRFWGPDFAYLTAVSGSLMALLFGVFVVLIFRDLLKGGPRC